MKVTMISVLLASTSLAAGCATQLQPDDSRNLGHSGLALYDHTPEAYGVLDFVNAEATTFEVLDDGIGLDRRAAEAIVTHRDGPDGVWGTDDDNHFDSLAELDRRYWVGPSTLDALVAAATLYEYVPTGDMPLGTFEEIHFTVAQAERTLEFANLVAVDRLVGQFGIDERAADAIVGSRPLVSIPHLAHAAWVGPVTLGRIKAAALNDAPSIETTTYE